MPAGASRGPEDVLWAAAVAGTLSGVPSTLHAMAVGDSLLASTRAAGTLLGRPTVLRGLVAHSVISLGWSAVLARTLPRRRTVLAGAVAGSGIAVLALGVAGRRLPAIRALPVGPQVLDHLAFGALVGAVLHHRSTDVHLSDIHACGRGRTVQETLRNGGLMQAPANPRPASAICCWLDSWRNDDWVASRFGLG